MKTLPANDPLNLRHYDPFELSNYQFEDGTNLPLGTPFREELGPKRQPWYTPSDAKGSSNWKAALGTLRSRFETFIDRHHATECLLVQTLIPQFASPSEPSVTLPGRRLLRSGGGLSKEPARLFGVKGPLTASFHMLTAAGKPFLESDGTLVPLRLGFTRHITVNAVPDDLRSPPVPMLSELLNDGTNILFRLPSAIAVKLWRNWQSGFSRQGSSALWLDALFEIGWQREKGSQFHVGRHAWSANCSIALIGNGLFPRLPKCFSDKAASECVQVNGYPLSFYSTIPDLARASLEAIDYLMECQPGPQQPTEKSAGTTKERRVSKTPSSKRKPPKLVLITVNKNETNAILDAFWGSGGIPKQKTIKGITYNLLGECGEYDIIHTICQMGTSGVGASQQRARQAISHWKPKAVIAVGVAFGANEEKQQIGDVLISTQIATYELARINENGTVIPRGDKPAASDSLVNKLKQADTLGTRSLSGWPELRFGMVLSGEKLVDNLDYRESLKSLYPEAIGGEMEAAGVYASAAEAKVDWIVVKAICDWGFAKDRSSKEEWQQIAARNAAHVLLAAFDSRRLTADFFSIHRYSPAQSRKTPLLPAQLREQIENLHIDGSLKCAVEDVLTHPKFPTMMSLAGTLVRNPIWDAPGAAAAQSEHWPNGHKLPVVFRADMLLIRRNNERHEGELLTYPSKWGTHMVHFRPWKSGETIADRDELDRIKFAPKWGVPARTIEVCHSGKFAVSAKIHEEYGDLWLYVFEFIYVRSTHWSDELRQIQQLGFTAETPEQDRNRWRHLLEMRNDPVATRVNGDVLRALRHFFDVNLSSVPCSFPTDD